MTFPYIPKELVNIVLQFYGRIKYRHGNYVNIIHKHDKRYNVLEPIINKKMKIIKNTCITDNKLGFYFVFSFDIDDDIGLCYDYNFSWHDTFEICYYDSRNGLQQIRTVL